MPKTKKQPFKLSESDLKIYNLRLRLQPEGSRTEAYRRLKFCETLTTYFKKYRYHEARQEACMSGTLNLEMPFYLARKVLKDLTQGDSPWQQGGK